MSLLYYLRDIVSCVIAVIFYGIIMSVPMKPLWYAAGSGALAYLAYHLIFLFYGHELLGYLVASLIIAISSEILARVCKKPVTIFVLPAIIPLVPGVGLYRTMLSLVRNDMDGFETAFVRTLFLSGIIAVTVAVVNAAARSLLRPHSAVDQNKHT